VKILGDKKIKKGVFGGVKEKKKTQARGLRGRKDAVEKNGRGLGREKKVAVQRSCKKKERKKRGIPGIGDSWQTGKGSRWYKCCHR